MKFGRIFLEQAIGYDRVDVVPDDYSNEHPTKAITRLNRGGLGTKVSFELMSKIVSKIAEFLDNKDNKDCLYTIMTAYFRQKALECDSSTVFVIVYGEETLLGSVPKSTHREADYRIISHIFDAISKGFTMTSLLQ